MNGNRRRTLVVGLATLLWTPIQAAAQASTDLAPGSRVEWAVEKLVGFGLIDDRVLGVRPWSRREALRLLDQARTNLTRLTPADREAAEGILSTIPDGRLTSKLLVDMSGSVTSLDSPWLPIPSETGADKIDAEVNHLVRYRGGRDFVDGETLASEVALEAVLNDHVSVQARPRAWVGRDATHGTDAEAQLLEAQARLQFGDFRFDVGRSSSVWGPGRDGGTLLANNARGLDRIRISSDAPFRWPAFLSFLGPSQAEVFFARLEADRDVPHSKLVGYNISVRPHRLVEAWISTLIQSGGTGAPEASFGERLADHLLLVDWIKGGGETFLFSNKATSVGFRIRMPALRNSQVFAEFTLEDKAGNPKRMLWQDAGWVLGVWVPRLDRAGILDLRTEFHHGGVRLHRHGQFTSGRTLDGRILGMGGPDTDGGFLELSADNRHLRGSLELGVENRSADQWRASVRDEGGLKVWEKVQDRPDELYVRGLAAISVFGLDGRELSMGIGVERVSDSLFQVGATRHDAILEVRARLPISVRK